MTKNDFRSFAALMAAVAENFGKTLSAEGIALRFAALNEFQFADVQHAASDLIRTRRYSSMPTVAEFVEAIEHRVSPEDAAEVQASLVIDAVRQHGGNQSVVFSDPVTAAVVQNMGWIDLCESLTVAELGWWRKDFVKCYVAFAHARRSFSGPIVGRIELHKSAMGRDADVPSPVMVGDADACRRVLAMERTTSHADAALPLNNAQPVPFDRERMLKALGVMQ